MRIGILTGGGDVPGLNACIKAVVGRAEENGWQVMGFRRGWAGPLNVDPDRPLEEQAQWAEMLSRARVRSIDRSGGTCLHTSRTSPHLLLPSALPPFLKSRYTPRQGERTVDVTGHILKVLERCGIDVLVPIGGDGTLSFAAHLHRQGIKVLSIPKTMDNDVFGTDFCIGFSTAISRAVEYITALRTTVGSHERLGFIELFGRDSGETALLAAYLADADRAVISEVPFDPERLAELLLADRVQSPGNYALTVLSEGASFLGGAQVARGEVDVHGNRKLGGIGEATAAEVQRITGVATISQQLAYLMRSGPPDALDRMVAISFGNLAMQQLEKGRTGLMMALRDGNYCTVPVETVTAGRKRVDVAELYDRDAYRPRVRHLLDKPMFLY